MWSYQVFSAVFREARSCWGLPKNAGKFTLQSLDFSEDTHASFYVLLSCRDVVLSEPCRAVEIDRSLAQTVENYLSRL